MKRWSGLRPQVAFAALMLCLSGCSAGSKNAAPVSPAPQRGVSLLFSPDAELTAAVRPYRRPSPGSADAWEVTKTFNSGRTRISAVRRGRNNNVTEYYTSTTGPNGSTGRRRVVAKSSNVRHGIRR
ncbi:MAG: hypothetical protein ACE5GE_16560 [Phycisphaerae bacterium]